MTVLLEIADVHAGYEAGDILHGIELTLEEGQVLALLGRNGVGKTTLMHAIVGFVRPRAGSVRLGGRELARRSPHEIARAGIALVPQGRRIFSRLSVEENLKLARRAAGVEKARWTLESVYELLPRLAERRRHRGNELSGGEQQMLAIGRALLANPRVLLFDEPPRDSRRCSSTGSSRRSPRCARKGFRRSSSSRTCTSRSHSATPSRS